MDKQEQERHGISLFKIDYEIDGKDNAIYSAGIVAFNSEEAVKSLAEFLRLNISDFKGFKIDQLGFQGAVHHLSDQVRNEIIKGAKIREAAMQEAKEPEPKKTTPKKKSVLKKDG